MLARVGDGGSALRRPGQALLDPLGQRRDLVRREFLAFAGHGLDILLLRVVDREDQPAGGGITRHDDRTDLAALQDELAGVQPEA